MAVPFMDLARLHKPLKEDMVKAFEECLSSSDFVLGPSLRKFEENFAKELNVRNALGVASGTDALLLTLHAIGVGPGDEIIVPAFGFVATVDVVLRLGATVVFVDVREDMTIDVEAVRAAITERTKAIVPVHLFGSACDVEALAQLAAEYSIYLVEDVAQATGGEVNGRSLGAFGISGAFSFYPTKNLGGLGDGGMVTTESDELAERVRLFRDHGRQENMTFVAIGYNSRLDSIQAAMLDIKLESLREDNADRIENARFYDSNLSKDFFQVPHFRDDGSHVYHQYTIRHPNRDELKTFLSERQIETKVYYPIPLHLQPCFEFLGYRQGHFPQAELAASQVLSIPMFPGLTRQELEEVVHTMELYAKTHPVPATS